MSFPKLSGLPLFTFLVLSLLLIGSTETNARPTLIEPVDVHTPGAWLYEGGIDLEIGRSLGNGREFNNLRLRPVRLEYGFLDWLQFSGDLNFSINSEDNKQGVADESGLEGVNLESRVQWNRNVATSFSVGFLGNDEVFPHSADGFNVGFNVPGQFKIGPGTLIGDLGFTFQSGDAQIGSTQKDRELFGHIGLGYLFQVNRSFSLTGEIQWQQETVDNTEDFFEFAFGVPMQITQTSHLDPSLTFGFFDGSPDFGLGLTYGYKFGNTRRYADEGQVGLETGDGGFGTQQGPRQESDDPFVMTDEQQEQDNSRISPGEQQYYPERETVLWVLCRRAFEEGNIEQATELYKQATELDPRNVEYQSNLGSLYFRQENYEKAAERYRKAIDNDPRDYFSHLYLGVTEFQLGNEDNAKQHLKRVLELQPGNEQAQQWLDRVES